MIAQLGERSTEDAEVVRSIRTRGDITFLHGRNYFLHLFTMYKDEGAAHARLVKVWEPTEQISAHGIISRVIVCFLCET